MRKIKYNSYLFKGRKGPSIGQIELTYKCRYRCVHCYCKNQPKRDLGFVFWKNIIDQMHRLGIIAIIFTGGDPLLYKHFLDIYEYAKKRGFLITVYTTGYEFSKKILDVFQRKPPLQIEITLNSLEKKNYERITGTKKSFNTVMRNIREIKKRGLPLILRCNILKENRHEILKMKEFARKLIGRAHFKCDPIIFAGLNHSKEPLEHRVAPADIISIILKDRSMRQYMRKHISQITGYKEPKILYHCASDCAKYFFITPQGIMRYCYLTHKYTTDLKKYSLREGYRRILKIQKEMHRKDKKCFRCVYRKYCYNCPAKAFLEMKDEQEAVAYFCELARETKKYFGKSNNDNIKTR